MSTIMDLRLLQWFASCFLFFTLVEGQSECDNYTWINDSTRAETYQTVDSVCDDIVSWNGWYRIGGDAGYRMSDSCVPKESCGGYGSLFLNDPHPTADEAAVQRQVCSSYTDCCDYSYNISVRNCFSSFYVYQFVSPLQCNDRYCTNGEPDIDECSPNPCEHGETCTDGINDYSCDCLAGYGGKNCSINIDECSPNPCEHGENCTDGINDYSCDCLAGYGGKNCSINIDECSRNPCEHGGNCADGINDYSCDCVIGYDGKNCSINIDDCSPNPCENAANCTDGINDYNCNCITGFKGKNCTLEETGKEKQSGQDDQGETKRSLIIALISVALGLLFLGLILLFVTVVFICCRRNG